MDITKIKGAKGHLLKIDVAPQICNNCQEALDHEDFFWCEMKRRFYCRKCILEDSDWNDHKIIKGHTDWHIIAIEETGGEKNGN